MENREAIEALRDLLYTTQDYPLLDGMTMFGEALNMAIAALEKQIPKRKLEKDQYNENLFTLRCPTCGTLIGNYNKRLKSYSYSVYENYCYICGQAIDFSEPQQEEQEDKA